MRQMWVVLVVAAACQAQMSMAQESFLWSSGGGLAATVADEKVPAAEQSGCLNCGQEACCCQAACGSGWGDCPVGCAECPPYSISASFGVEAFHGCSDLRTDNFGAVAGLNAAMPIPGIRDRGFGWQLGMTYGVYDWDGNYSTVSAESQQQIFVTTGFFRKAHEGRRLSYGVVYDWMFNTNWGYLGTNPTLGQWRGQIEYALSNRNAVGVYGCARDKTSRTIIGYAPVNTRAIDQVNIFWRHKFEMGADSRLWVGVPDHERYSGDGSLYDWIIGAQIDVPLSQRLALYANAQYMHPSSSAGATAAEDQYYNISAGVVWYFGGGAKQQSINGACWQPYLPVANNSTFLVEQNRVY